MSRVIELRLKKLEMHRQATAYSDLTYDELQLAIYEVALRVMSDPDADPAEVESSAVMAADIRNDIIVTAQRALDPNHQEWIKREFGTSHIPAVTCGTWYASGEGNDLRKPRVMERRTALRNSETVQSILKEAGLAALN